MTKRTFSDHLITTYLRDDIEVVPWVALSNNLLTILELNRFESISHR